MNINLIYDDFMNIKLKRIKIYIFSLPFFNIINDVTLSLFFPIIMLSHFWVLQGKEEEKERG